MSTKEIPLVSRTQHYHKDVNLRGTKVTTEDLKEIAARHSISFSEDVGADYLYLLNSLDATVGQIADLPAYIDPRLAPDETTLPREWSKPTKNPLNAWSHLVSDDSVPTRAHG